VIPWGVLLLYLIGAIILAVGLYTVKKDLASRQGLDKIVALGPLFVAVPISVFGMEHFTATKTMVGMVPKWIPGHLFWVFFVGACHIGAALSIALRKYVGVTAALLGVMILLFVILIHIPGIASAPASTLLWVVALRDLAFSGGALSIAAAQAEAWKPQAKGYFAGPAFHCSARHVSWRGASSSSGARARSSSPQVDASLGSRAHTLGLSDGCDFCGGRPVLAY
jgi:uncharacterized membrane protein